MIDQNINIRSTFKCIPKARIEERLPGRTEGAAKPPIQGSGLLWCILALELSLKPWSGQKNHQWFSEPLDLLTVHPMLRGDWFHHWDKRVVEKEPWMTPEEGGHPLLLLSSSVIWRKKQGDCRVVPYSTSSPCSSWWTGVVWTGTACVSVKMFWCVKPPEVQKAALEWPHATSGRPGWKAVAVHKRSADPKGEINNNI